MFSIILVVAGITIYRKTIIDPWVLVLVVIVGAAIAFILLWKKVRLGAGFLGSSFLYAFMGGGCSYCLFLFLNAYTSNVITTEEFPIMKSGTLGSGKSSNCRQPYVYIDFHGLDKRLVFKCNLDHEIESYTTVRLQYKKGLFGFPYIEEQELFINKE